MRAYRYLLFSASCDIRIQMRTHVSSSDAFSSQGRTFLSSVGTRRIWAFPRSVGAVRTPRAGEAGGSWAGGGKTVCGTYLVRGTPLGRPAGSKLAGTPVGTPPGRGSLGMSSGWRLAGHSTAWGPGSWQRRTGRGVRTSSESCSRSWRLERGRPCWQVLGRPARDTNNNNNKINAIQTPVYTMTGAKRLNHKVFIFVCVITYYILLNKTLRSTENIVIYIPSIRAIDISDMSPVHEFLQRK